MIIPARAIVRPRGICPATGDTLPLDELVESFIAERNTGAIEIVGGRGAGKSMALSHVASVLCPGKQILYMDDATAKAVASAKGMSLVVYTTTSRLDRLADESLALASWGDDELIEYLRAAHPTRCASVISRIQAGIDRGVLGGNPELWRIVLDRMARDEAARDVREIIRAELSNVIADADEYWIAQDCALATLRGMDDTAAKHRVELISAEADDRLLRLLRQRPVQLILGADRMLDALAVSVTKAFDAFPRELIRETALMARNLPVAMKSLEAMLRDENHERQATAASILHATKTNWRPQDRPLPHLAHARLRRARWPSIDLSAATLTSANLTDADLSDANLSETDATGCRLDRANLQRADFTNAVLHLAKLEGADLSNAILEGVGMRGANLTSSRLHAACLRFADLRGCEIENADFTNADLTAATLNRLPLHTADFAGATFFKANLIQCDMEGMRLPDADFHEADLRDALLTGSVMPRVCFLWASLFGAGLADVQWEGADLRNADLRNCSFHLGSSRSGLVGSPLACEGSRTGFYTDDYDQQNYKAPEEIRKANLRGADLRGAKIDNVDFYLVDLRDAIYTADQADHLRRCGAILMERAAS